MDNWQDQLKDMVNKGFDIESAVEKMKQSALEQQVKAVQERSCKGCLYENKMGDEKVICLSCARWFGDDSFKDRYTTLETKRNTGNKRSEILDTAKNMVNGSRQQDYGDPEDNFSVIAKLWSAYCGCEFTAHDVAIMMVLLKVGRISSGKYNPDNYIDGPGYFACAGEIAERSNNGH